MAMIKCPECGKEISNKAISCPNCGYPLDEYTHNGFIVRTYDGNKVLSCYVGDEKEVIIPQGINYIGNLLDKAFKNNKLIEKVVLPHSCKVIGFNAFQDCVNLKEIVFNEELEIIKDNAFFGCVNLENVTLPKNLKELGNEVFYDCEKITDLVIPEGIEKLGYYYSGMFSLKEIYIPENVKIFAACKRTFTIKHYKVKTIFYNASSAKIDWGYDDYYNRYGADSLFPFMEIDNFILGEHVKEIFFKMLINVPLKFLHIPGNIKTMESGVYTYIEKLEIDKGIEYIDSDYLQIAEKIIYHGTIDEWKKITIELNTGGRNPYATIVCEDGNYKQLLKKEMRF